MVTLVKCRNFVCDKEAKSKKGYCVTCLHSCNNVVAQCKICDMTYTTTIGMEKLYCSARCRGKAYQIRKKLGLVGVRLNA